MCKVMDEVVFKYVECFGGYICILCVGICRGDGVMMVFIELV